LLSHINVSCYIIIESYYVLFLTYYENPNHHTGDLIEHTGLLFHKVICARCDIWPRKFCTDTTWLHHHGGGDPEDGGIMIPWNVGIHIPTLHRDTSQKITIQTRITVKMWKFMLFVSRRCLSDIWCSTAGMCYKPRASQRLSQCVQYQENQRSSPIIQTVLHKHTQPQTSQHVFLQTATRSPQVSSQYLYVLISNFISILYFQDFSSEILKNYFLFLLNCWNILI
jgi:hypothetical protein